MNIQQYNYMKIKSKYDEAFEQKEWDLVDQLEDSLLDAEFALVDWVCEMAIEMGKMTKEECEFMKRQSSNEQWEKMVDMGMRVVA